MKFFPSGNRKRPVKLRGNKEKFESEVLSAGFVARWVSAASRLKIAGEILH